MHLPHPHPSIFLVLLRVCIIHREINRRGKEAKCGRRRGRARRREGLGRQTLSLWRRRTVSGSHWLCTKLFVLEVVSIPKHLFSPFFSYPEPPEATACFCFLELVLQWWVIKSPFLSLQWDHEWFITSKCHSMLYRHLHRHVSVHTRLESHNNQVLRLYTQHSFLTTAISLWAFLYKADVAFIMLGKKAKFWQ